MTSRKVYGIIGVYIEHRPTRIVVYPRLYCGSDRWFIYLGIRHWRLCLGYVPH